MKRVSVFSLSVLAALALTVMPVGSPSVATAQQAGTETTEGDTGDLRARFIKPPEGVEYDREYVEELIEVERPESHSVARGGAVLRGLDKISGRVSDIPIAVGGSAVYERLTISVDQCRATADDEAADAFAFVRIADSKANGQEVFSGWMFASSPALSAMDHQRYDVWVLSCSTS